MVRISKETVLIFLVIIYSLFAIFKNLSLIPEINHTHFTDLASSFLHGKTYLMEPLRVSSYADSAFFNGKDYIYFGFIPALLMIPFVALFDTSVSQQILVLFFLPLDFYLFSKILCQHLEQKSAVWLTVSLIFGSVFTSLSFINISAYLVQFIATSFLIMALYEFFNKKRWILIGVFVALSGLTRFTLYLSSIFFITEIIIAEREKAKKIFVFLSILFISLLFQASYNQIRFNNIFDTGYLHASLSPDLTSAENKGFFSPVHTPGNLYFFLFKGPDPVRENNIDNILKFPYLKADHLGLGIFYTSPIFLYLFLAKRKDKHFFPLLITSLILLLVNLSYYGSGTWQYGYRYAVDFYPFLFLLLPFENKLPAAAKVLIIYGVFFTSLFVLSPFGKYIWSPV